MDYYQEAQAVANVFGTPVGIYKTGTDDARYKHWEWKGVDASGSLTPGHVDIVYPSKGKPPNAV